jgi:hypothetical protein
MQQMTTEAAHEVHAEAKNADDCSGRTEVHAEAKKNAADDCRGRTMGACRSEEECCR